MAKKRVALVIGNSAYEYAGELSNPANDAEDIQAALTQLGFKVIYDIDLEKPELEAKLHEFAKALSGADIGLFFYAGHGLEVDGENYIMPIDAELSGGKPMLPHELVELEKIQTTMGAARTKIILLDACRNNPLARKLKEARGTRAVSVGHGLAMPKAGSGGTLIGFSTRPGAVAEDGKGKRNSPFSAALKSHILTPGLSLDSMLKRVRRDVIAATGGKQVPWDSDSLVEDIYLGGEVEIPAGGGGDAGYRARLTKQIKNSTSVSDLDAFKRLHPAFGPMIEARKKHLAFLQEREEEEARKRDPAWSVKPGSGESFRDKLANGEACDFCPEMVVVPAGSFMMGSPDDEEGRDDDEGPQREVTFAKPFAVGKFEVTWDEWDACVADGGCDNGPVKKAGGDNGWGKGRRPVIWVNWNDAKAFAAWLAKKTGKAYRLLSEAEWEYAARAGTTSPYWWGADISTEQANFGALVYAPKLGNKPRNRTVAVDNFEPNPWGVSQVHGNVAEWVEDCHENNYQGASIDGRAHHSSDCGHRTIRGGDWALPEKYVRSSSRGFDLANQRSDSSGLRIARTIGP